MSRLLHLVASDQRRGAETFAAELSVELRRRGHEVDLLAVEHSERGPHLDVPVAGASRLDPRGMATIVRAARQHDVIVSFGSTSLQAAAVASVLTRTPFVYRNIGDPAAWQSVRGSAMRVGLPLRRAAHVVAVFPAAREELIQRYRLDPARVTMIPRGVPEDRYPVVDAAQRTAARRELGLDPSLRWVAWIGALSEEKRPLDAIRVVTEVPDCGLILCGDGPMAAQVAAEGARVADRVRLLGPVPDVRPVLAASDALLLTSRTEGIPGVAIEAGLSGLPVVASRVGGVPALVEDGETGWLVEPGDIAGFATAIGRAVDRRDELGTAAAVRCRAEFSMTAVGAAWDAVLRSVLSSRA